MLSINIDMDFPDHPKTQRLAGVLGVSPEPYLLRLWIYCAKYHWADGRLNGYSSEEIEGILRWTGAAGKCIEALLRIGFLQKDENGYFVHDWKDYQSHIDVYKSKARLMREAKTKNPLAKPLANGLGNGLPKSTNAMQCNKESLPENLRCEVFLAAWIDWEQQNINKGRPLTPATRAAQLADLSQWGKDSAISSIRESIKNNWNKLVKPKTASQQPQHKRAELPTADEIQAREEKRAKELEAVREEAKKQYLEGGGK